jgi:aminoglycoside phosphotransferase (APT) family kinase protein
VDIDTALVARLIGSQFPQWSGLPMHPAEPNGWDNRTFRLGPDLSVRLPSAEAYAAQVRKEQRWLPLLAPHLPLPIPVPVARGGPPPGPHNFFRGGPLETYDSETRRAIAAAQDLIDTELATAVWEDSLAATWHGRPVWVHGDVAAGNLLVQDGRLTAVIDFGCSGVGDPACDLTIVWTLLSRESRDAFRSALPQDAATWRRGRGWALWKALITYVGSLETDPAGAATARRVIDDVLDEHVHPD